MPHAFMLALLVGNLQAEPQQQGEAALTKIRAAMAGRDVPAAEAAVAEAKQLDGDSDYDAAVTRLEELTDYVGQFWDSYDKGLTTFGELLDEIVVKDTRMAVVEATPDKLIVRINGLNRNYSRKTVPPGIALAIAERVLKPDSAKNKVIIGAFAAMDAEGDRAKAKAYWQAAATAGINIDRLLPELKADQPLPVIEIPTLTPQQKLVLNPKNWKQRVLDSSKNEFDLETLTIAEQNDAGQLVVKVPSSANQMQLVTSRAVAANFGCRVIVQNAEAGQQFGLFAADGSNNAVVIELPAGSMLVEFARVGNEYKARIAGEDVDVKIQGDPKHRFSGHIGITAPAGSQFNIVACEMSGR